MSKWLLLKYFNFVIIFCTYYCVICNLKRSFCNKTCPNIFQTNALHVDITNYMFVVTHVKYSIKVSEASTKIHINVKTNTTYHTF